MLRLIIAGSRNFTDYEMFCEVMHIITSTTTTKDIDEVVSGTARGVDRLGERWAKEHDIPIKKFPAQWDKYGKRAGYLRNEEMAKYATHLIAFWDTESKGTGHMIDSAKKYELITIVVDTILFDINYPGL